LTDFQSRRDSDVTVGNSFAAVDVASMQISARLINGDGVSAIKERNACALNSSGNNRNLRALMLSSD
jgi:hypothetical protein